MKLSTLFLLIGLMPLLVFLPGFRGRAEEAADADTATVVGGNTAFALELYARLRAEEGNLFLSPFSVSTALAMTWAGARGETEAQMARVLHFDLPQERLHRAFASLAELWQGDTPFELSVANALWGQQGSDFLDSFRAVTAEHYGAGFREVDFERAIEQAVKTINTWVADNTDQKIEELFRPGDLQPNTVLALTNAIYFKGTWVNRFDPDRTRDGRFRISSDESIEVPMMNRAGNYAYASTEDLALLAMPYEGDRLSMVILLPRTADGLAGVEESLTPENLEEWLGRLREKQIFLSLPRFKFGTRYDLTKTLPAMGMTDAFNRRADFSGMNGEGGLFISRVVHQAEIEVNEEGTEAAAATGVGIGKTSMPPMFTVDHPFLFLIRDTQTGSILFIGRVVNPA
jgi:serpin B